MTEKNGTTHWLRKTCYILLILGTILGATAGGARLWADQYYAQKEEIKNIHEKYVTKETLELKINPMADDISDIKEMQKTFNKDVKDILKLMRPSIRG